MTDQTQKFLDELSDLSRKHGLGLTGEITLFVMEPPEDFALQYAADDESRVQFT